MAKGGFFAIMDRLRHIGRWGLMRNTTPENVQEHSMQTAMIAHALGVIGRDIYKKELSPERLACAALYHDCSEIFTGDLPTPVKYYSGKLSAAYKEAEKSARDALFAMLPPELSGAYREFLYFEEAAPELYAYIRAADKLSAYIKCVNEGKSGNGEFANAENTLFSTLSEMARDMEELAYFIEHILPDYGLTIDEIRSLPQGPGKRE